MSQISRKPKIRTLGEFIDLYDSVSDGDPTLPVPRDNKFYGFLSVLRQCKLNVDNHLALISDDTIQIRLNEKTLANIEDRDLRNLFAYRLFEHFDVKGDNALEESIGSEYFEDMNDEMKNLKVLTVVFSWGVGWPSKSEKDEE